MAIKQVTTANTFAEWLNSTQSLIEKYNFYETTSNTLFSAANNTVNVYSNTVNTYNDTVNVYSNTVIVYNNTANTNTNVHITAANVYNTWANVYTTNVTIQGLLSFAANTANTTNSAYAHANSAFDKANGAYAQANLAYSKANSGYDKANSSYDFSNTVYDYANSANAFAVSTYTYANSGYIHAGSSFNQANLAYDQANLAIAAANSVLGNIVSQLAFDQANLAYNKANSANVLAQASFDKANSFGTITITDDTSSDATRYLILTPQSSGNLLTSNVSTTKLYYNPSTGTLSSTNYNSLSDIKLKKDIISILNPLQTIEKIDGVEFKWIENDKKSFGVIAQELEKIIPELVEGTENKTVNYIGLIAFLINAIKELNKRITDLENK